MKVVILAGGYGTRISEESAVRPKPMVKIGKEPILWHVMKIYAKYGLKDFVICAGYKSEVIKEYFEKRLLHKSDVTFNLAKNKTEYHNSQAEDWKVTIVGTGDKTMTGGRLKRVKDYIGDETFCMTYGDGVSDIDIKKLVKFHKNQGTLATTAAVKTPGRFGAFRLKAGETKVRSFREKSETNGIWINGGFFVLESGVFDYIKGDDTVFEREPMEKLAKKGQLSAYVHPDFWQCMDTLRDKHLLEDLWQSGNPPWKVW